MHTEGSKLKAPEGTLSAFITDSDHVSLRTENVWVNNLTHPERDYWKVGTTELSVHVHAAPDKDGVWRVNEEWGIYVTRADSFADATPGRRSKTIEAVNAALDEWAKDNAENIAEAGRNAARSRLSEIESELGTLALERRKLTTERKRLQAKLDAS